MRLTLARSAALVLPLMMGTAAYAQSAMAPATTTTTPSGTTTTTTPAAPMSGMAAPAAMPAADLSKMDKEFVTKAAEGGMAEVQMAQLAQQKSQNDSVKQFAQSMIDDHTPANKKLAGIATAKGLTPPTEPNAMQQKELAKLQTMDGAKFDHAYLAFQVKAHETMLKLFERESTNGKDTDIKAFAETMTPTIQKHITMAQTTKA